MSRALVTGARGFAGSHLVEFLARSGDEVTGWGREDVDLLDGAATAHALDDLRPDVVYHCAGISHVGQAFDSVADTFQVNVMGTHHLLDGLRRAGVSARVVVIGSSLVYRQADTPLDEQSPIGPATPYAVSKLAQEMLGLRSIAEDGQQVLIARAFNHTGPRQDPSFSAPSFARQIALIEKGARAPEILVGNLDAARDLHDVRDTVRAYAAIGRRGTIGRIYNVCSGRAYRIHDVLDRLLSMSRVQVRVTVDASRYRPSDNPILVGEGARIARELGWEPEIPLDRTLADLLDYWRSEAKE